MTTQSDRPSVFDAGLPTINYEHATDPAQAHDIIRRVRQQSPIALGQRGPEVLTYELVRTVLRDTRFRMPKGLSLRAQGITSGPVWDRVSMSLMSIDGAEHDRRRRLVSKAFGPRAISRLTATIVDVITELVEPLTRVGRCDVVTDVAKQFPIPIICALIGAPRDDWELFSNWTVDIFKAFKRNVAEDTPAIMRAYTELDVYIDAMLDQRRSALTDDLVSDLIRAEEDGDRLTHDELRSHVAGLLTAGTDTARNQLSAAVQVLCAHPDQWQLIAERPELASRAVDEAIRHSPVTFATFREAAVDIELDGVVIPEGTMVIANTGAANRDPAVYSDPERFDIHRDGPAPMTFGGGAHYCLGSHLARNELTEAIRVITRCMPNARVAGAAPWKPLTAVSGPLTLPLEFDAAN